MNGNLNSILVATYQVRGEVFIIRYRRRRFVDALRALGRLASDPRLPFGWEDASRLSKIIVEDVEQFADAKECKGR